MLATVHAAAQSMFDNGTVDTVAGLIVLLFGWEARSIPKRWRDWRYERLLIEGTTGGPGIPAILPAGKRLTDLESSVADLTEAVASISIDISTNGTGKPIGELVVETHRLVLETKDLAIQHALDDDRRFAALGVKEE